MSRTAGTVALLTVTLSTVSAHAHFGPSVIGGATSLPDAIAKANVIVVSRVLDESQIVPGKSVGPVPLQKLSLRVEQVVYGSVPLTVQADFAPVDNLPRKGAVSLMFLVSEPRGQFRALVDPEDYPISVWPKSFPESQTKLERVCALFVFALEKGNTAEKERAVDYLRALGDPHAVAALRVVAAGSRGKLRGKALAALIQLGDTAAVQQGVAYVEALPTTLPADEENVADVIAGELYRVKDPAALPALVRALRCPRKRLREGAIYAIRDMRLKRGVPAMVEALSDSDRDVQYQAVMGLWETLNKEPFGAPSGPVFDQNPEQYLNRWKKWWAREGHKKVWTTQQATSTSAPS